MFILMSALFIIACYKVYSHELKQEAKIKNLMLELELLNADTDVERNEFVKNVSLGGGAECLSIRQQHYKTRYS